MNDSSKIHAAMIAVMRDIGAVGKDQKNIQQNFMFRGIDQVYNAAHTYMAKHGIYSTSEVVSTTREERTTKHGTVLGFVILHMRYKFYADDGSSVTTETVGEGMDAGDKATNKAMAIAHKYALLQAFMVPTEQIDPDSETHEVTVKKINAAQSAELSNLIDETGANIDKFCDYFNAPTIDDIAAENFPRALASLKKKQTAPIKDLI